MGRRSRTVTAPLKRALNIRDQTCRFPGCCNNRYVDFHHVKFWGCYGFTEPDNLLKLCRFHHAQLHKGNFNITLQQQTKKNHGQKWLFTNTRGEVIEQVPKLAVSKYKSFMKVQWPNITSKTGVVHSSGAPLNYPKALKDLLWCKYQQQFNYRNKKPK